MTAGHWLVAGGLHVDRLVEMLGLEDDVDLPGEAYQTVGGLVADRLGRIPQAGDASAWRGWNVRVERMSGLRVQRVRISRRGPGRPSGPE